MGWVPGKEDKTSSRWVKIWEEERQSDKEKLKKEEFKLYG